MVMKEEKEEQGRKKRRGRKKRKKKKEEEKERRSSTNHISSEWPLVSPRLSSKYTLPHPMGNCSSRPVQYAVSCSRSSGNKTVRTRRTSMPASTPKTILVAFERRLCGATDDMMATLANVRSSRNQTRKAATSKVVDVVANA